MICHTCRRPHHDHTVSTGARELTRLRRAITRVYQMYWARDWLTTCRRWPGSWSPHVSHSASGSSPLRRSCSATHSRRTRSRESSPRSFRPARCSGATGVVERVQSRLLSLPRRTGVNLKLRQLVLAAAMAIMIALLAIAAVEATDLRSRLGIHVPGWVLTLAAVP